MDPGLLESHLHGMVVHFPIALLFASVLIEMVALYRPWRERLLHASLVTLILGTLGAAAAVLTGPEETADAIRLGGTHERFAQMTLIVFGLLTLWRVLAIWRKRTFGTAAIAAYLVLCAIGVGLLGYTGFLGGTMVYEEAAGVRLNGQLVAPVTSEHRGHD